MIVHFDVSNVLDYFGVAAAVYLAAKLLTFVSWLLRRPHHLTGTHRGKWAVVTGATDGIGKAYAFELAARGLNVVLVSRTSSKLAAVREEIASKHPSVDVKTVAVDFVHDDAKVYRLSLARALEGLEVLVLVNNVGMSYDVPALFLQLEEGVADDLVKCNISSLNNMTALVLPQMAERGHGYIINLSSLSGVVPSPLLTVYSATKAYVDFFSRGLAFEYAGKGVVVQSVSPAYVVSNMSGFRKPSLMAPTPETFVRSALGRLGRSTSTMGYWAHDLMAFVSLLLPSWLACKMYYGSLLKARHKLLKRKEKSK